MRLKSIYYSNAGHVRYGNFLKASEFRNNG